MAMGKRRATPSLLLLLVVSNANLIRYNLVAARNRSLNAPWALASAALPHGFAERVETPGRHSSTSRLGSRCCDDGNGVNVALGYSSLFRAHILGHGLGAWLAMVRNLMDDDVATDDVRSSGVGMASGPPSD